MIYLEHISPGYYYILLPLMTWRILSVGDLKRLSGHAGSQSSFYKIVTKLEKNKIVESFQNVWSNEKFIYLLPNGLKLLGDDRAILPVNLDQRFHDSIVTKVALNLSLIPKFSEIYLDHNIPKSFPLMEKTPDILVTGLHPQPFRIAVEIELTQKSKTRLIDIFKSYSASKVINNVIYITDKKSIFEGYSQLINEAGPGLNPARFIFILEKNLNLKVIELTKSKALFKGGETTLHELLKI